MGAVFKVYRDLVVVLRRGSGFIRRFKALIRDREDQLPWYMMKSEGFKGFLVEVIENKTSDLDSM